MEVRIIKKEPGTNFLSKVAGVLFGIFITSIIFAFSIKLFDTIGIYVGLGLALALAVLGFLKAKPKTTLRMITWGISVTIVFGIVAYVVGMTMISNLLEGF